MPPYRYSFETDEQYAARVKELTGETIVTQSEQPPATEAVSSAQPKGGLPLWLVILFAAVVLVGVYQYSQKKLKLKHKAALAAATARHPKVPGGFERRTLE